MKYKVEPKAEQFVEQAKILEKFMNNDVQSQFNGQISMDISMKLVTWELLIGKEMLVELLRLYTEKQTPKVEKL
jgi:hypothetical protein